MRLAYLGTPPAAVPPLQALVRAGFDVAVVVTRADKRRSRRGAPAPTPVKAAALELGLPVTTDVDDVLDADAELGVVVAFGRIIKPHVLDRLPMVNVHFSLLPRWRGAAPVERAILAGDPETGVCLMALDEGLDTGPVYRCERLPIGETATAADLRAELVEVGTRLLVDTLQSGLPDAAPQTGEPTYADKIEVEELHIDWTQPAAHINRLVRVGGAWTTLHGERLKLWSAAVEPHAALDPGRLRGAVVGTGQGSLRLLEVQPAGKPRRGADDWLRGARLDADTRLGT